MNEGLRSARLLTARVGPGDGRAGGVLRSTGDDAVARARGNESGYIMVALLIGIAVSAIWMGAMLPTWRHQVIREKEAELIFRGEQYARAVFLYRQKNNNASPISIDMLVNQKYLRKKYLDPITGKDFIVVGGVTAPGGVGQPQQPAGRAGRGVVPGGSTIQAGITGVRSTSNDTSVVIYRNQQTYSQFPFDWALEAQRAGAPVGGPQAPGQTGRPGRGGLETIPGRGQPGPGRGATPSGPGRGGPGGGRGQGGGVVRPGRGGSLPPGDAVILPR
jgi:hypothetical protein